MKIHTEIKEALRKNKLIFFVGSGFSKDLGFPDWNKLLSSILEELSADYDYCNLLKANLDSGMMDTLEILDKLNKKGLKPLVLRKLDKYFQLSNENKQKLITEPSKYKKMTEISKKIITTNYDQIIETANKDLQKITYDNQFRVSDLPSYENFIFKLHGCIEDPSKSILFRDEYDNLYNSDSAAVEELKKLISDNTIVFLGFSLNDDYVKYQFDYINSLYSGFKGNHFLITTEQNTNISGIESIKLDNWSEIDNFLESLLELKVPQEQVCPTQESENIAEEITNLITEKVVSRIPRICLLVAEPINKDVIFDKNQIIRAFKNYDLHISIEILSVNKLNSIEDFDYLFIFTEVYNNKILIEDEYMTSKFISLTRFEEELYQEDLKGVFLFSNNGGFTETSGDLINSYVINIYDGKNFNSQIFKLLRKNKAILIEESTIILNETNIILPQISRGKCVTEQKQTPLSSGIDPKNLINFVGRISDLESITRKCLDSEGRVFSIKASGGIGKTTIVKKMATEFAKRNYYKDGIVFIDCEHIHDLKTFEYKMTQCFELDSTINIVEYLQQNNIKRDLLLILDNFESLLYLSNKEDTSSIKNLISIICDYSTIVITTRELLDVEYEEFYDLRPLTTDEAENLFKNYYKSYIKESDRKILRESILENLLNNNPLAIKIVTSNIPYGKNLLTLKKDLEKDFFDATTQINYEEIFDEKVDINIERSKSLFHSINYSYSKLKHREQLVFELLALFPDGINMVNFKTFFDSEAYRRDVNKITDKEIRSLENKSLIQVSNGSMKLQSIVGRFANRKFNDRSESEKKLYYKRAFEYNHFILETIEDLYLDENNSSPTFLKVMDKQINNFIECIKFVEYLDNDKYETLQYIKDVCANIQILELPPITSILENIKDLYSDIENGVLLIDIIILKSKYYDGDFEKVLKKLSEILPLNATFDLYNLGNTYNEKVTSNLICSHALDIYSYKQELKVLELAIENSYPLNKFTLKMNLFKLGLIDEYEEYLNTEKSSFFYCEIKHSEGNLRVDELQQYIDGQYTKAFTELTQLNYIKAKMGAINKKTVIKLVPVNPYTKGLKNLMLAFLENNFDKAYFLYQSALEDLKHINYYYIEAMYYFSLFLKENKHEDYNIWFNNGRNQSKECGYRFLLKKFNSLENLSEESYEASTAIDKKILDKYINEIVRSNPISVEIPV
ncbi:SIR2 family protein [Peribacillus sp. FSL M8-0224]|uniref:SIR2 family protein n=1 Tax=Peribacillus sp. FSL M8-0224 TaxID=2921568 RepID=UPI0030FAA021